MSTDSSDSGLVVSTVVLGKGTDRVCTSSSAIDKSGGESRAGSTVLVVDGKSKLDAELSSCVLPNRLRVRVGLLISESSAGELIGSRPAFISFMASRRRKLALWSWPTVFSSSRFFCSSFSVS